ncbi:MAG TPA: hypothetical protein PK876_01275 [Elusimicrobiota bacterium]|nr:hypothetical protein [Elusimicrobiota bacterium]
MKKKYYYTVAYIAAFGTLWGLSESTLGTLLHALGIPMKGALLTAIGAFIVLCGARLLPDQRGIPLIGMGFIAGSIKILSLGYLRVNILTSILIESLLLQAGVSLFGYNRIGFLVGGMMACLWPLIQRVLIYGILFGHGIQAIYLEMLRTGSARLGIPLTGFATLLTLLFIAHASLGALVGFLAWRLSRRFGHARHDPV